MSLEKWKTITTYKDFVFDGKYEVSNWGNIRSVDTKKNLATFSNREQGYLKIRIKDMTGYRRPVYVHQLVAFYFVPGTGTGKEVNHKDGNIKNNSFTNLEWVSHRENMAHYFEGRKAI